MTAQFVTRNPGRGEHHVGVSRFSGSDTQQAGGVEAAASGFSRESPAMDVSRAAGETSSTRTITHALTHEGQLFQRCQFDVRYRRGRDDSDDR